MSERASTGLPSACSGDMYAGVPTMCPSASPIAWASRRRDVPTSNSTFARPKSSTLTRPSSLTMTLAGLRSRCVIPCWCAAAKRIRQWNRDLEELAEGEALRWQHLCECLSLHQLHRDEVHAVGFFDGVHRHDVGVIERRDGLGFSRESRATVGVIGQLRRQDLEGDLAIEPRVLGQIDLAHPARADLVQDLVVGEGVADLPDGDFRFCPPGAPTLYLIRSGGPHAWIRLMDPAPRSSALKRPRNLIALAIREQDQDARHEPASLRRTALPPPRQRHRRDHEDAEDEWHPQVGAIPPSRSCDQVLGGRQAPSVIFELGQAWALGKRILLIASPEDGVASLSTQARPGTTSRREESSSTRLCP